MAELTLGVDLSDTVARIVVVNGTGQVVSRGQLPHAPANFATAVRDTARRAIAGAGGKVSAAGTAAAVAEQWCGAARGLKQVVACSICEHVVAGMAVANLVTMIDSEAVVLGASIANSGDLVLEAIRLECSRRLRPAQNERVRIVLSTLGADAVAIGAARVAARPPA